MKPGISCPDTSAPAPAEPHLLEEVMLAAAVSKTTITAMTSMASSTKTANPYRLAGEHLPT